MFWNGTHWTNEHAATSPVRPRSRRRLRDTLASIPILLLVPALLFPFLSAGAGALTPTLTTSGSAVSGGALTVEGSGFSSRDWVELRWDGTPTGTTVRVDSGNRFTSQIIVPASAAPGTYQISAHSTGRSGKGDGAFVAGATMLAVVSVEVGSSTPVPSPTPVATPTPAPTPTATPAPPRRRPRRPRPPDRASCPSRRRASHKPAPRSSGR